jgi:rubredoxin
MPARAGVFWLAQVFLGEVGSMVCSVQSRGAAIAMGIESESSTNLPETSLSNSVDVPISEVAAAPGEADAEQPPVPLTPYEMDRYECRSCGYSYEPVKGDDRAKIPTGTAFEALPVNWRCPVCSAPKKQFSNIGPAGSPSGFKENLNYGLGVNRLTPGQKNILIFGALALGFLFFISLYGLK